MNDKKSWDEIVRYAVHNQDTTQAMREKRKKEEYGKKLKRLVPIPIIIGVLASLIMYYLYGGRWLNDGGIYFGRLFSG